MQHGTDMLRIYIGCVGAYILALPLGQYPLGIPPDKWPTHQHSTCKRVKAKYIWKHLAPRSTWQQGASAKVNCHEACSKEWRRKRGQPPKRNTCELRLVPWQTLEAAPTCSTAQRSLLEGMAAVKGADRPKGDTCEQQTLARE